MNPSQILELLAELTAGLIPSEKQPDIEALQKSIAESLASFPEEPRSEPFSYDLIDEFTLHGLQPEVINQILLTAVYSAQTELVITSPYFVPDENLLRVTRWLFTS